MSRSWTRFSVRSLLVVIALACVYFGSKARIAHRQKEASADLRRLGGQLEVSQHELTVVTWLSGNTMLVTAVHFLGPKAGDEAIHVLVKAASRLPQLKRMTFTETRISEEGSRKLKSELPNLEIQVFTPVLVPLEPFPRR